jgi:predicted phosphoribosyltransferase
MAFQNREDAGHRLARELQRYRNRPDSVIVALPRGGVAVGYAMSLDLHLPMEVCITRKIGAPENPEYALGAVSESGHIYLNPEAAALFRLSHTDIEDLATAQREEIRRRQQLYRRGRPPLPLNDRTVILVDDGIATGATFFASVEAIRRNHPRFILGVIPVGPPETIERARAVVDELVALETPSPFWSVGSHYAEFGQVSNEEVIHYLALAENACREKERPVSPVGRHKTARVP